MDLKLPTASEQEAKRKEYFGDEPGSVRLDVDYSTGAVAYIFVDGDGMVIGDEAVPVEPVKTPARGDDKPEPAKFLSTPKTPAPPTPPDKPAK